MSETYTEAKQDKAAVGYSPAHADVNGEIIGDACGRCANYRPSPWRTSGACIKVAGVISGRYWCRLFEARGGGDAAYVEGQEDQVRNG